jgi:hypothetical protein
MITPYQYREIEDEYPVEVYRNVTKKGVVYSIRQHGLVVAHATEVNLVNAEFIVKQAGRKRVKKTGTKNVHAFVRGELIRTRGPASGHQFQVVYNPKRYREFRRQDLRKPIKEAKFVVLNRSGVWADNYANL